MGVLTLLNIRNEVASAMGTRSNVTPARRDVWINLAYTEISSGIKFTELDGSLAIPTVVGQNAYTGPVNPMIVHMLRDDTNNKLLTAVTEEEYFRLDRSVANAKVERWTRRATQILVWPNPDAIVTLTSYFKITPTALVADGDVTVLPPYTDNALLYLSIATGLMAVGEDQRGIIWVNRAISYLGSRITEQDFSFLLGGLSKLVEGQKSGGLTDGT